jgi:hypothetical protein
MNILTRDDTEHGVDYVTHAEAQMEIEGWRNKWECAIEMAARAEVERDEARELAQQMSESNQVLMADVRFYRNAWEQRREAT